MEPPVHVEFHCAVCGALAAALSLDAEGVYAHTHYMGAITERASADDRSALALAIAAVDPGAIHALNKLWAPFYCPECEKVYCGDHWRVEMQFEDEEGLPGWYDCAYGTCPNGHRRLIDD